jgi:hypothetical protein
VRYVQDAAKVELVTELPSRSSPKEEGLLLILGSMNSDGIVDSRDCQRGSGSPVLLPWRFGMLNIPVVACMGGALTTGWCTVTIGLELKAACRLVYASAKE